MRFFNHSTRKIWLGVYDTSDTLFTLTALPFGARVGVEAGSAWTSSTVFPERMQAAVWDSGFLGTVIAQPRTVYTTRDIAFAEDGDGQHLYNGSEPPSTLDKIQHVFVVMMENRSFDHALGWLYADQDNRPSRNIPAQYVETYDGLTDEAFWNTPLAADHEQQAARVYAQRVAPGVFTKPDPNPPEICPRFIEQMFGTENPMRAAVPDMSGFIQAYSKTTGGNTDANGIMESYTPDHLPRLSQLATQFAVCDRWFGSVPCMTYPNRAFLHAGTSFGRLNNNNDKYSEGVFPDFIPNLFAFAGKPTVFDECDKAHVPFSLYTDSAARLTLLGAQFFTIAQKAARPFRHVSDLAADLSRTDVHQRPWYTFIEPEYAAGANDQHPPLDVRLGDMFIGRVFDTLRASPIWRKSILVVLYDEHGGCFDHVAPPRAVAPDDSPAQFKVGEINPFEIYGPRVPAVFASPHIGAGTVLRNDGTPHDHTSVLSSLRDMIYPFGGAPSFFTNNARISAAPTFWSLFTPEDQACATACEVACTYLLEID